MTFLNSTLKATQHIVFGCTHDEPTPSVRVIANTRLTLPRVQMASQPSFDPLSGPDPLAAFTQAREPSNSWMSFDDEDATSAGPFHQSSMASNVDAKSMESASGQVTYPASERISVYISLFLQGIIIFEKHSTCMQSNSQLAQ